VPFAKAYSGLTDEEMREVDSIVRKTTVEKFGPVSSVTPSLVFELGFEGIALSRRHKSGIAVRFPRMLRDLAGKLGKKVDLITHGEATELDKGLIEKITDPLTHLIRNSCDHGIELPDVRLANGKPEHGAITLSAAHQGGSILIETVFSWPGTGFLLNSAIFQRDLPLLQGTILVLALFFVLLNLIVDLLQTLLDPRIARA